MTPEQLTMLAREAVVYYLPLYEMARMQAAGSPRRNSAGRNADPSQTPPLDTSWRWINLFSHRRQLLGAADRRVVTSNADTLYSNAWLNLQRGPLLVQVPDTGERYQSFTFLDFWTNPFAYAGTRAQGNHARTYFIHGQRWNGKVPEGTVPIVSPTNDIWLIGRIQADRGENLSAVHSIQDSLRVVMADRPGYPFDGTAIDTGIDLKQPLGDPSLFLQIVNQALRMNPAPASEAALMARFAALGFGPEAAALPDFGLLGEAVAFVADVLAKPFSVPLKGGWSLPFDIHEGYGRNYALRARVARNHIGAVGHEEAFYVMAEVDGFGQELDGQHRYLLHFPADALPEAFAFWSVTMYRKSDRTLVENTVERHCIGSRTPGLRFDANGGLTITMGAKQPPSGVNWLPAPPEPFYIALRLYQPGPVHLERRFSYPPIQRLD